MTRDYDVIIVGASFAGLAVARELHGRILLLDRQPIGHGQTSACGTSLRTVEQFGLEDAVLQVHRRMSIHAVHETIVYDLEDHPFCTVDYRRFCDELARRMDATFQVAVVHGLADGAVDTDCGRFRARCLVDASGWRAVLARALRPDFVRSDRLSFGLDTVAAGAGDGLCFWFDPALAPDGVTWMFPVGGRSRIGMASYRGVSRLGSGLARFVGSLDYTAERAVHGGFFPWQLREPTVGPLFVVGNAAGHCLPVTGEGIRPALKLGSACGRLVQCALDGEMTLGEARARYRHLVLARRPVYQALEALQRGVLGVPAPWTEALARTVSWRPFFSRLWALYAGSPTARANEFLDSRAA